MGGVLLASKLEPFKHLRESQGVYVTDNSPSQWREALLQLIDDNKLKERLFKNAQQYVLSHHESSMIAQKTRRHFTPDPSKRTVLVSSVKIKREFSNEI